eukprot:1156138-Pelagomonas_calceolata.AAC.17
MSDDENPKKKARVPRDPSNGLRPEPLNPAYELSHWITPSQGTNCDDPYPGLGGDGPRRWVSHSSVMALSCIQGSHIKLASTPGREDGAEAQLR